MRFALMRWLDAFALTFAPSMPAQGRCVAAGSLLVVVAAAVAAADID